MKTGLPMPAATVAAEIVGEVHRAEEHAVDPLLSEEGEGSLCLIVVLDEAVRGHALVGGDDLESRAHRRAP